MDIIHVINYFQPKLGYQETFLARAQLQDNHNVKVVTSDRFYPFPNYDHTYSDLLGSRHRGAGWSEEEGIPVIRLKSRFEIHYRLWLEGLETTVMSLKPDLVIVHTLLANAFRIMRLRKQGHEFRLVVDDHLIDLVRQKNLIATMYNKFKSVRLAKYGSYVDKFVGVTRESCRILEEIYKIPENKIEYIPLGADSDRFRFSAKQRDEVREELNLLDSDVLLVTTGKVSADKGVETLVKAFNQINSNCKVKLLLIGSVLTEYKKRLLSFLPAEKRKMVTFHDFVPNSQLTKYYNAADICVWGDTISCSMLEAMSCCRPIVGCDILPVQERVEFGNGLCYRSGDHNDLQIKLEYLIENPSVREEMGKKGRRAVEEEFSWQRISERFLAV